MYYEVIELNVDVNKDKRPTKAQKKTSLYRDSKSKIHRTWGGRGVVSKLFSK